VLARHLAPAAPAVATCAPPWPLAAGSAAAGP